MPKQIKKEQIKKSELIYRKWSVAGLAAAAVFMGCMAGLMSLIVKTEGAKSANDSAFCGVHYLHGSVGGMCGAWSEKLCKGRLRSVSFSGYSAYLQRYSLRNECENGIYNTVLSVRLAIGGRYPYRKPIAERIYTKSVCKLDMSSHCYSVLSGTWYFGGSMACEK